MLNIANTVHAERCLMFLHSNRYAKSADQGNSNAIADLGIYYDNGQGCEQNQQKGTSIFLSVVLFVASMCDILKPCTFFLLFLSKFKKAIECYTKSAEMGYSHAMYCLGKCFKSGWGMVSFLFCGLRFAGGISCSPSQLSKSTGTDFFSFVTLLI